VGKTCSILRTYSRICWGAFQFVLPTSPSSTQHPPSPEETFAHAVTLHDKTQGSFRVADLLDGAAQKGADNKGTCVNCYCNFIIRYDVIQFVMFPNITIDTKKSHSFIPQSVLRQVYSFFQREFSTQCDLVFPLSISTILSFR
jgi:hypothetical protein